MKFRDSTHLYSFDKRPFSDEARLLHLHRWATYTGISTILNHNGDDKFNYLFVS